MDREKVKGKISGYSEEAFVLAYFYDKVCIGKIKNGKIIFNNEINYNFLTQIRIFNREQEIRYVLDETTNEFQETKINDTDNNKENDNKIYVDEDMYIKDDISKGLRLKVRNYYKEDGNNQLVFANSRLVSFWKEGN